MHSLSCLRQAFPTRSPHRLAREITYVGLSARVGHIRRSAVLHSLAQTRLRPV